jgi:hypothetical protein
MRTIFSLFILILSFASAGAQEFSPLSSTKPLDSLVSFDFYGSDSLRRAKIDFNNHNLRKNITRTYHKWDNVSKAWDLDFALQYNNYETYYNDAGTLLHETRYMWDTNTSVFTLLFEFKRDLDGDGHIVYEEEENWDMEGNSTRGFFKNFEYDDKGKLIFENKCDWTDDIKYWYGKYQHEYEYDSNDNKTRHTEYRWNEAAHEWVFKSKEEWEFSSGDDTIVHTSYIYETGSGTWEYQYKYEQSLNDDGVLVSENGYEWDTSDSLWLDDKKRERTFDDSGNWTMETTFTWSAPFQKWVNAAMQERTFNDDGRLISDIISAWNHNTDSWEGYSRKEMEYDESGNIITLLTYQWLGDAWLPYQRTNYSWDMNENKTMEDKYQRDEGTGNWTGLSKKEWAFDTDNDLLRETVHAWHSSSSDWRLSTRDYYYYEGSSSVPEIKKETGLTIYPNPAESFVNISGGEAILEIQILTIGGQSIKSTKPVNSKIDISNIPAGMYIIAVQSATRTTTEPIIIVR